LLADDSPTIQRLVTNTFADGNFDIVSVSNGEAAIRKFEDIQPSVVLADIYMPGKNGYEVCAYVRQHPSKGGIPVVLLVGAFDAFDEEKAREAGATANITKPFEPQALVSLVESILPGGSAETPPVPEPQKSVPTPAPVPAAAPPPPPAPAPRPVAVPVASAPVQPLSHAEQSDEDLLGLESLFPETAEPQSALSRFTEEDIDRIAERVIQRISAHVIESIAWEIVPDITERIVREELKKK